MLLRAEMRRRLVLLWSHSWAWLSDWPELWQEVADTNTVLVWLTLCISCNIFAFPSQLELSQVKKF